MDAFIAVTGDDKTNIITTLVAGHMLVPRTIALVNKLEYLPITTKIGMDAVVSKQLLTVNAVQRHIQQKEVESIASLPGIQAQLLEFVAQDGDKITKKQLTNIKFPVGRWLGRFCTKANLSFQREIRRSRPATKWLFLRHRRRWTRSRNSSKRNNETGLAACAFLQCDSHTGFSF